VIMVDFAHNPDGLLQILSTIPYPNSGAKKILVFGCEGGKDQGKRKLMGEIAAIHSDYCIISTDNVYREDPLEIAKEVEEGVLGGGMDISQYQIILDRHGAIQTALKLADPGDVVIIAGKGHETSQILHDKVIPFNDCEVVKKLLHTL